MATPPAILVVDDEHDLAELVAFNLRQAGFEPTTASSGDEALRAAEASPPDLVILDVNMPGLDGFEVAKRLRRAAGTAGVPIIMLTARTSEPDELAGLASGADDYITKPFSMKVLLARVVATLRRRAGASTSPKPVGTMSLHIGPLALDPESHNAALHGEPMHLTLTEFRLLAALAEQKGKVMNRSVLIRRALGPGVTVTERTIDVHITSIRKKLGDDAGMIRTVRGVGYRAVESNDPNA
jgi:two-component system phosphate regulon response regulator PhoB